MNANEDRGQSTHNSCNMHFCTKCGNSGKKNKIIPNYRTVTIWTTRLPGWECITR